MVQTFFKIRGSMPRQVTSMGSIDWSGKSDMAVYRERTPFPRWRRDDGHHVLSPARSQLSIESNGGRAVGNQCSARSAKHRSISAEIRLFSLEIERRGAIYERSRIDHIRDACLRMLPDHYLGLQVVVKHLGFTSASPHMTRKIGHT